MNLSRVAIKQLTASDLSFFSPLLKRAKQKGINLNSDVFIDVFYPGLKGSFDEFAFPLSIIGPGGKPSWPLTRKAWRTTGSKNWRLDGEFVTNPPDQPGRFDGLREGDFAVLAFGGVAHPDAATLILVSATEDTALHRTIHKKLTFAGRRTMVAASQTVLSELLEATQAAYGDQHPLEPLLLPDTIEEAVFGSAEIQHRIAATDGRGVAISQKTMRLQLRAAEEVGQQGEEAFDQWLEATDHTEDDYEWVSRTHARATHDFHVRNPRWQGAPGELFVDVKATKGAFESPVHMSMAEIRWAAAHPNHRIARVHGLGSETTRLTMLTGVHELAKQIIETAVPALPGGVSIDGFEIDSTRLEQEFTAEIQPVGD